MVLNQFWLWAAAIVSLACWAIHTFVGGAQIVPPLLASDLQKMPKHVLYFVWHIVTIVLLAIAAGFLLAALYPAAWPLAVQGTILSLMIALLILGVAIRNRMPFKDMPQWALFGIMGVLGALAVWT